MAGVYHNGGWVEIDGATVIRTYKIKEELEKSDNEWEYTRALQWVLDNASYSSEDSN